MNVTLVINVNIGDITDLKVKRIQETVGGKFASCVFIPGQLIMNSDKEQLILNQSQIQYSFDHNNYAVIKETINKILDLLMIESLIPHGLILINEVKNIGKDAMGLTKSEFGNLISESIGVGKREFFIFNNFLCEIRIEPFINDTNCLYLECKYNLKDIYINNINLILKQVEDDYNSKCKEIYSKI